MDNTIMEKLELLNNRNRFIIRYNNLRDNFIKIASLHIRKIELQELILFYNNVINSKRESDRIKDVGGLLKILEKRAVLSYKTIEPIKNIADAIVKDDRLDQDIQNYLTDLKSDEALIRLSIGFNIYKFQSALEEKKTSKITYQKTLNPIKTTAATSTVTSQVVVPLDLHESTSTIHIVQPTTQIYQQNTDLQTKVFQIVSESLGRYWRDVARFLDIKESEIDTIEINQNLGLTQKSTEVFQLFKSRCEVYNWQQILIRALTNARRKDLVELVQELSINYRNNY